MGDAHLLQSGDDLPLSARVIRVAWQRGCRYLLRSMEREASRNRRIGAAVVAALAAGLLTASAGFAEPVRIGVAAPLSGDAALLGVQVRQGAAAAAEGKAGIVVADDGCSANGGEEAARRFAEAKVAAVVGFLCKDAIEAALPILGQAGIPVLTVGVRFNALTDRRARTGWPVYRLGARDDSEGRAIDRLLPRLWRERLFAIVDDGTLHARELAEGLRLAAEQAGLKPVFLDTYRPQMDNQIGLVGRLRKAGATHVFVGGDRDDVAIMGRDAAKLGAKIAFAGGESLRAAASNEVTLPEGTLMVAQPEWAETADPATLHALGERGIVPEGYFLPAYAAVEIVLAATDTGTLETALGEKSFSTVIGPVAFDAKGDLKENPYRAFRFENGRFVPLSGER